MLGKTEAARFWILPKEMYANKNVLGVLNLQCLHETDEATSALCDCIFVAMSTFWTN